MYLEPPHQEQQHIGPRTRLTVAAGLQFYEKFAGICVLDLTRESRREEAVALDFACHTLCKKGSPAALSAEGRGDHYFKNLRPSLVSKGLDVDVPDSCINDAYNCWWIAFGRSSHCYRCPLAVKSFSSRKRTTSEMGIQAHRHYL